MATVGALAAIPVPPSATLCGLSDASSVICRVAWRKPEAPGVNVTLTEQVALAASAAPGQVPVAAKSAAFAPESETVVMFKVVVPEFATVRTIGALGTFGAVSGNEIGPEG